MRRSGRLRFLAPVFCVLALASCGGSNDTTGGPIRETSTEPAAGAVIAKANANCRQMLREIKRIAAQARGGGYGTSLATTTEGLAVPATRLVKRVARRQRSLARKTENPKFGLYTGLFDPIIVLAEERIEAGRREDAARSEQLQELLTELGDEQRLAARGAGLSDCEVDFFAAMVHAFGN